MNTPDIGWPRIRKRCGFLGTLDICYRPAAPEWVEIGERYWRRELTGLQTARLRDWGGVTKRGEVDGYGHFYFKRFAARNPRYLYKTARARRTVALQARAAVLGFGVPEAVCLIERRRAGLLVESAVIMKPLEGWAALRDLLKSAPNAVLGSWLEKRKALRALGMELGRRHAAGLFHGDLHLGNVFCRKEGDAFAFSYIDNEEGAHSPPITVRRRIHDLNHINRRASDGLTHTDRALIWRAYLETAELPRSQRRAVRLSVVRKSRKYRRKKERRAEGI